MADTIEEQNKLLAEATKALAESRKKLVELGLANDEEKRKEILRILREELLLNYTFSTSLLLHGKCLYR